MPRSNRGVGSGERSMAQPAKGQEPSMEEILASIRRIIADEPSKISRNANARRKNLHRDGLRNTGASRDNLRTEHASYGSSDHESLPESMAPDEEAPPARGPVL